MSHQGWMRRLTVIGCALALGFAMVAPANADDLDDQKAALDAAAAAQQSEVDASTAVLQAANARVADAQASVAAAQEALAAAQAALEAAQEVEKAKAAELDLANRDLAYAQARERQNQAAVDAQQDAVGEYARAVYQDYAPLISVAVLFNTNSSADLSNRIQWNDTVLATNQVDLDNLRKLQAELVSARAASQEAQTRADAARQEAQAQVDATAAARQAAQDAEAAVQAALAEEQSAQSAAADALAADQAMLDQIAAERDQVNAAIAERARQAELARQAEEAAQQAADAASRASSAGLVWPTDGVITSYYGYRIHPIWGTWLFHDGLDIGAGCGVPVVAVASGVVSDEYYSSGYGYRLFIDHGWVNGAYMESSYNHLSGYAVPPGSWVAQGQTVAYVGTTGNSTGCHLHFMLWVNGSSSDPLNYLP